MAVGFLHKNIKCNYEIVSTNIKGLTKHDIIFIKMQTKEKSEPLCGNRLFVDDKKIKGWKQESIAIPKLSRST